MMGQEGLRRMFSQDKLQTRSVSDTLKRFFRYFGRYTPILLITVVLIFLTTWMQVVAPDLIGQVVDCYLSPSAGNQFNQFLPTGEESAAQSNCWLQDGGQNTFSENILSSLVTVGGFPAPTPSSPDVDNTSRLAGVGRLILILIGLYVGAAVINGLMFFMMSWAGQNVLRNIRVELFERMHSLSIGYYSENEVGDLMSRITNDTDTIQQALSFVIVNVFSGALLIVWIAYSMLARSVPFALLSLIMVPAMVFATNWFSKMARRAFRVSREELGSVNTELQEGISAVREVQAFNRADENIEQFKRTNAANRDANIRAVAYTSALAPVLQAMGFVALAIVVTAGGLILLEGGTFFGTTVSLGLIITFVAYVQRFNQPIQQISVLWTNLQNAVAGAERIFNLLDESPAIQTQADAGDMAEIDGEVTFAGVTSEYKPGELVLKGVDFTAKPGQTVAIVGPTGAGKTTLINLIPRFYDVLDGSVTIDGVDVRSVTPDSLRKQIGIVLQDTFLFSTSVMENIRFGRPDATDEDVIAAAKLTHADTFIERLPDKYGTVLGERGSGLSQGQRQLLSIARAALADPRILILDEATSSVDTRTERLIQAALDKLLDGRTSFVIAHRLSTIRNADVVLVIDDGIIVESGTHDELLSQNGVYNNMYMSQFWRAVDTPSTNGAVVSTNGKSPETIPAA